MTVRVLLILSCIASVFCLNKLGTFVFPLWLLCVIYTLFLFLLYSKGYTKNMDSPGMMALVITMFGRYSILPVIYYYTNSYNYLAATYQYMNSAVYLMLYEQICVLFMFWLCLKRKQEMVTTQSFAYCHLKNDKLIFAIAMILFVYIAIRYKSLGEGFAVLQSGNLKEFSDISNGISAGEGYINIIWQTVCIWIYVYLVMKQKALYEKSKNKKHIYTSVFISFLLILLSFIDQTGLSRWYTIVITGSCLAFLCHLFPSQKSGISNLILLPAAILLVFATLVKNLGFESAGAQMDSSVVDAITSSLFDAYFAGPTNVNSAIALDQKSKFDFFTIFNDILNNMPVVNHFLDPTKTTVYGFNDLLGRIDPTRNDGDQIIPLVGQSLIYFSFVLAPLLSVISVRLAFYFDDKFRKDYTYLSFCYGLIAIWFGVGPMMLNLTIIFSWIYIRIIPFWLLFKLTNGFSITEKQQKEIQASL